jgi:hypothetical protein
MPQQTIFFEQQLGEKRILVVKSYDRAFAREVFEQMQPEALSFLERTLKLQGEYEATDIASPEGDADAEALWEGIQDSAREDWNTFSYFVVSEEIAGHALPLYVSSDWLSAEAFAMQCTSGSDLKSQLRSPPKGGL